MFGKFPVGGEKASRFRVEGEDGVVADVPDERGKPGFEFAPFGFGPSPLGDILDGEQDETQAGAIALDMASVEEHDLAADVLELVVDLEVVEGSPPGQDLAEQLT